MRYLPAILATICCGCASSQAPTRSATSKPAPLITTQRRDLSGLQRNLPVKQGRPPIVYLTESAGTLRIVDAATGARLIEIPVDARTPISIDARTGIHAGDAIEIRVPIAADHDYVIYLDPPVTGGEMDQTLIRPGKSSNEKH